MIIPMSDDKRPLLLCLDLEVGSDVLAAYASRLAKRCELPLHVLYVLPKASKETEEHVYQRLKEITDKTLRGAGVDAVIVRQGIPEDHIVSYANQRLFEFVLLGRRRRSTLERIYVGGTTCAVISLSHAPVLVVPVDLVKYDFIQ